MYFENFPTLYYTLDNNKTGQIVQDIFRRIVLSAQITNNNVLYEEYEIQDGDTPEILSDKFYDDPALYWVILITNGILDPRFDWPMDWNKLEQYIERKYPSNLYLESNVVVNFNKGETITSENASARILSGSGNRLNVINVEGEFFAGDYIVGSVSNYAAYLKSEGTFFENYKENTRYYAYLSNSTVIDEFTAASLNGNFVEIEQVSNRIFEIRQNDTKRSIKILKPTFVGRFLEEFRKAIA